MKTLGLVAVVVFVFAFVGGGAGCGHIPKADPTGVPPPWPPAAAPIKTAPSGPVAPAAPEEPAETPARPGEKPVVPPMKRELLPQPAPPPQT